MFMWIYYHHPMEPALIQNWKCFPHIMLHPSAAYARQFVHDGVRGIFVCGEQDQLEHYVMCKVWDDPETNVGRSLGTVRFFGFMLGSAAEPMKKVLSSPRTRSRATPPTILPRPEKKDITDWRTVAWKYLGTADRMKELGSLIADAESKAVTSREKERVALWRHAFWDWMKEGRAEFESSQTKTP